MTGNPVVTLNRAVAAAMVDGPEAGLAVLDGVADRLAGYHRLDAVRAHLLEMAGDRDAGDRVVPTRRPAGRPTSPSSATSRRRRLGSGHTTDADRS